MISLAGTDLTWHDPALLSRAITYLDPRAVWAWSAQGLPPGLRQAGWRPPVETPIRPGVLIWPAGVASQWAYLHVLASRARMEAMVAASTAADNGPLSLVFDDANRPALTVPMYLLPPRPLYDVPDSGGTFLLTLVDDRWRWWQVAADLDIDPGTTTWAECFAQVATALGITITVDTPAAAYPLPSIDVAGRHVALPPLLDAGAASIGMRLCRDPDATVRVLNVTSSRARETANLALLPRLAGGALYTG